MGEHGEHANEGQRELSQDTKEAFATIADFLEDLQQRVADLERQVQGTRWDLADDES